MTSIGAAPARPETARSHALASSRLASSCRPHEVGKAAGAARSSIENMRMKAGLALTMRPSRRPWPCRTGPSAGTAPVAVRYRHHVPARQRAVEHEHRDHAAAAMAAADQVRRERAPVLAQEIEIEPGGARLAGAPHARMSAAPSAETMSRRVSGRPTSGSGSATGPAWH